MTDVFLSYSRDDQAVARRFAEAFQREGFSVWWDQALNPGEAFDQVTEKALEKARAVVVLWSKKSVESRWVRAEATQANASGRLVPVMIEPCKRPIMFELTHTVDLSGWKGDSADSSWQSFIAGLRKVIGAPANERAPAALPEPVRVRSRLWLPVTIALGAGLLLVGGWALWKHRQPEVQAKATAASQTAATVPATMPRLLVLPFTNLSAEDQGYFASGLTEELLTQLQQIRALTVLGRETSFALQGKPVDAADLRERLRVDYLLSGSVRKDGDRVRITPELTNTADSGQLWRRTYEGSLRDVWTLQEEIAREVARELSITLDVGELTRAEGGTTSVEAYDKFMMGMDHWQNERLAEAERLFREAARIDPEFVRAWLGISGTLAPLASGAEGPAALAMARERMEISSRLDAMNLPGQLGLEIRAVQGWYSRDWKQAVDAGRALVGKSNITVAFLTLIAVGRFAEAIPIGRMRISDDPLAPGPSTFLIIALTLTGREAEARSEIERLEQLGGSPVTGPPDGASLTRLITRGSAADVEDLRAFRLELQKTEVGRVSRLFRENPGVDSGDTTAVRAMLEREFADPANHSEGRLYLIADLARFYGDEDLAFRALRLNLIELKNPWPFGIWEYPTLRGDPRFKQLLRDMGLVDYWRSSGNWADFCEPVGSDDFRCT